MNIELTDAELHIVHRELLRKFVDNSKAMKITKNECVYKDLCAESLLIKDLLVKLDIFK